MSTPSLITPPWSLKLHFRRIRRSGFRTGQRVGVRRKARNTVHAEEGGARERCQ
ncbi:hypothetical protein K443DRAFT_672341 [Laccaria amethystina LaAM-08-1]|uniref:Uncharacterized protein n=1 Tax=Laccaria amethystina LaAM-08-1 TaxID=1095629 RepID=A0A0C9X7X0_9AGAR|nr:hypothetical protein K443DRAFT_672341 [Laccaria amethystina LaAM-08-1]